MKVTKTSVHRLTVEKTCGCQATREYEDHRYAKPLGDGQFTPCDKHRAQKAVVEFAGEMLLESLDKEAETIAKAPDVVARRPNVAEGDSGGVQATGESVQAMGMNMPPKVRSERRGPLAITTRTRPADPKLAHLNTAAAEPDDASITITGDIDTVAKDPRLSSLIEDALGGDPALDAQDMKDAGIPQKALQQEE